MEWGGVSPTSPARTCLAHLIERLITTSFSIATDSVIHFVNLQP